MSSLDQEKSAGEIHVHTQDLEDMQHKGSSGKMIISLTLSSHHVCSESRVCACILLPRLSLAEMRDHSQSKADKSTDSLADVTATRGNELCNGLE